MADNTSCKSLCWTKSLLRFLFSIQLISFRSLKVILKLNQYLALLLSFIERIQKTEPFSQTKGILVLTLTKNSSLQYMEYWNIPGKLLNKFSKQLLNPSFPPFGSRVLTWHSFLVCHGELCKPSFHGSANLWMWLSPSMVTEDMLCPSGVPLLAAPGDRKQAPSANMTYWALPGAWAVQGHPHSWDFPPRSLKGFPPLI